MIKQFSNTDSKIYKFGSWLMDMFTLNMLFLLTCLPIFTIGVSSLALSSVMMKRVNQMLVSPTKTYLEEWKSNFWKGIMIQGIICFLVAFIYVSFRSTFLLSGFGLIISLLGIIIVTANVLLISLFVFPYQARYKNTILRSFYTVFQVLTLNLKESLFVLLGEVSLIFLAFTNIMYFSIITFFMFFMGFSCVSLMTCYFILKIFSKYENTNS